MKYRGGGELHRAALWYSRYHVSPSPSAWAHVPAAPGSGIAFITVITTRLLFSIPAEALVLEGILDADALVCLQGTAT